MKKTIAALFGVALLAAQSCVGAKVYRAEKRARLAAENREKVLMTELLDRKLETTNLIKSVGDLNRGIGRQETEIKDLQSELATRTQSMGESASKLAQEKSSLEKQLTAATQQLNQRTETLQQIRSVQEKRRNILGELEQSLKKKFEQTPTVTAATDGDAVVLTLPDKLLFEPGGLVISAGGKALLEALAEFFAARPSLDAEIVAYTDNVLPPKEKTLKDTWEWSLARATNVVRTLIRDYNTNANQLTPVAKGEFYPITSNETPDGRAQNRRTNVVIHPVLPAVPSVGE